MATTTDYRVTGKAKTWMVNGLVTKIVTITPTAAGLNDVWEMLDVPANSYIVDVTLDSADLDSNGSPALTFDVGDSTTAARFISASNIGQAGGIARMGVAGSLGYNYTADTTIQIKCHAAAATFASGDVTLAVTYTADP